MIPVAKLDSLGIIPLTCLMPQVDIDGDICALLTPQLAGVANQELGQPVASLAHLRDEIVAALDLLFTGF